MHVDELPNIETVLVDPSMSYWLKDALRASLSRDPVDAARDAELLSNLLISRADASNTHQPNSTIAK